MPNEEMEKLENELRLYYEQEKGYSVDHSEKKEL